MHCAIESRVHQREAWRSYVAPHVALRAPTRFALALLAMFGTTVARSQTQGSFGVGVGTARYPGGTNLSTATFSPALTFESPTAAATFGGSFASLPLGVWSSQGRADGWVATPAVFGGLRLGLQGIGAGTTRTDGDWTAAAHGVAELLWAGRTWGVAVGAGPSAGWIANAPSVTALHTRARAWWRVGAATYSVGLEPTRFLGAWFTDASTGVTTTAGAMVATFWGTGRISAAYGSKAAGGVLVQVFPVPSVALELGGGSYLPDPYQGLPRAAYVTAGLRLFTSRPSMAPASRNPTWPPLVPERRGDSVIVRFRMPGATSVAIGGDWDRWEPHSLRLLGNDLWEGSLMLRSGAYHFNLRVDGKEWVVPGGVATVTDGTGGIVGELFAP
jgi:hypothetical protein